MYTWRSYDGVIATIKEIVECGFLEGDSKDIVYAFKKAYTMIRTHHYRNEWVLLALGEIASARAIEAVNAGRIEEALAINAVHEHLLKAFKDGNGAIEKALEPFKEPACSYKEILGRF